jgi:hypothetical protein
VLTYLSFLTGHVCLRKETFTKHRTCIVFKYFQLGGATSNKILILYIQPQ